MTNIGEDSIGLWDEQDEFYYDVLNLPGGKRVPLRVHSIVGLIPLFAVQVLDTHNEPLLPDFAARAQWFIQKRPDRAQLVSRWQEPGSGQRFLLSLLRGHRTKCLLRRMLDESEFLSDYGVRAISKVHGVHPFVLEHGGTEFRIGYVPGESTSNVFGGNSNWRGPIWMPINYLIVEALYDFHRYYGDDFKVECPVGSGRQLSLREVADELRRRLARLFLRNPDGRRPVLGENHMLQNNPHFRDHVLFYEYFHGDTGRGIGAAHQTGWTGLIALLLHPRRDDDPSTLSIGSDQA
jgi:Mannosylglycerate hydrolase MGH1-like glycoside hydrolase domain